MEQLLPWVERELRQLRRRGVELALKYPRVAGRLGQPDGPRTVCELPRDPHVDRLIQAAAMLHARIAHSMDRASPLLDEVLLTSLFPGQLRPFPSCAVFRMAEDAPCGTPLQAQGADGRDYRFRLSAAATGCGVEVVQLRWRPYAGPDKEHLLSLSLAGTGLGAACLRLYVNAEPVLRGALLDALLMHAGSFWVSGEEGELKPLQRLPVSAADMSEVGEHAWQVLREYQCFSERFNFIDLDLAAIMHQAPREAEVVTLHVALPVRADAELARMLSRVEAVNLLTGCAPAANLFAAAASPVDVHGRSSEYGLAPADASHVIWSVDSVHLLCGRMLEVLRWPQTMRYGEEDAGSWTVRRALPDEAGPPMRISIASAAAAMAAGAAPQSAPVAARDSSAPLAAARSDVHAITASVALTCCDRAMPSGLVDVHPQAAAVSAVSRLREVEGGRALRWRLLAMLALEARAPDAESLRLALSLQDLAASDTAQKLQSALADLRLVPATLPMRHRHGVAPIDGTEILLTLDERALVGTSVAVFVHVIDQYLSHSVHLNSFIQLVAISAQSGEELMRCRPRNGNLIL